MFSCTHLVLYVRDLSATHNFYVRVLGCSRRRYAPDEDFLSVGMRNFVVNFYGPKLHEPLSEGYSQGVGHLGLELPTQALVKTYFSKLQGTRYIPLGNRWQPLETPADLETSQTPGPYRFYVRDPDGYTVEIHSWEGVNDV